MKTDHNIGKFIIIIHFLYHNVHKKNKKYQILSKSRYSIYLYVD